jgi:ABC-type dipeptide/oligopeptide/nickel transport system permease component
MLAVVLRRIVLIPIIVMAANFLGFAYASSFGPIQSSLNPYSSQISQTSPLLPAYFNYLNGILSGNWGTLSTRETVVSAISRTIYPSVGILALALIFSTILGLFLGMRAIRLDPPRVAGWLILASTIGLASPSFYIGIILVSLSVMYVIWGPGLEPLLPFQGFGWDTHLILPTMALMAIPTVRLAQLIAGLLVEELGKQYVTAARSFGHTTRSIFRRHAFRNIIVSITLTISGSLRFLVVELIIIERLFSWPGIGRLLSTTLIATDNSENFLHPPLLAALLSIFAVLFLLGDLVAVLVARRYDPRIKG